MKRLVLLIIIQAIIYPAFSQSRNINKKETPNLPEPSYNRHYLITKPSSLGCEIVKVMPTSNRRTYYFPGMQKDIISPGPKYKYDFISHQFKTY